MPIHLLCVETDVFEENGVVGMKRVVSSEQLNTYGYGPK